MLHCDLHKTPLDTATLRITDSVVEDGVSRCVSHGVKADPSAVRALLIAELKLSDLGVVCDFIERYINIHIGS